MVASALTGLTVMGLKPKLSETRFWPVAKEAVVKLPVLSAAATAISLKGVTCVIEVLLKSGKVERITVPAPAEPVQSNLPPTKGLVSSQNVVFAVVTTSTMMGLVLAVKPVTEYSPVVASVVSVPSNAPLTPPVTA